MGSTRAATAAGRKGAAARAAGGRSARKAPTAKPRAKGAASKPGTRKGTASKAGARKRAATKPSPRQTARRKPTRASKPARPRQSSGRGARRRPLRAGRGRRAGSERRIGWRARLSILALVAIGAGAGYMFWLRDSTLVAVTDVEVVGVRIGDREQIVAELTSAAKGMSTLHLDRAELDRVGARFATIASLSADPNFPHGLRIEVVERPPALIATSGGKQTAVAADGTVLAGVDAPKGLPSVGVEELPAEGRLSGADLEQALVAGAAPAALAPLIEGVGMTDESGVEVVLRGGVPVRFGEAARVEDKWTAAAAVLADPKLTALGYLDVRVPGRPTGG